MIITETLKDGTEYSFDTDVCEKEAHKKIKTLWKLEDKLQGFDYTCAIYKLFMECAHILNNLGWSKKELLTEINNHTPDVEVLLAYSKEVDWVNPEIEVLSERRPPNEEEIKDGINWDMTRPVHRVHINGYGIIIASNYLDYWLNRKADELSDQDVDSKDEWNRIYEYADVDEIIQLTAEYLIKQKIFTGLEEEFNQKFSWNISPDCVLDTPTDGYGWGYST